MISIANQQKELPNLPSSLRRRTARLLEELGLSQAELSIVLCDDEAIRELNAEWRGKDKATDVLSFPIHEAYDLGKEHYLSEEMEAGSIPPLLGDIVISTETCVRQAKEWGHTPCDEAIRLCLHGLLHLCGYDHEEEDDAVEMKAREDELLQLFRTRKIKALTQLA